MRIILFSKLSQVYFLFNINVYNYVFFIYAGFSGGSNFRSQNGGMGGGGMGGGMGGRSNFMDQPGGNRGGMGRYPDSGSRDFSRPNVSQFPGGSSRGGDRRPDFESLPPPPS